MYITRHDGVYDPVVREKLWELYQAAYAQTAPYAASDEMARYDEFADILASSVNETWVGWDDSFPMALTVVCRDITRSRYLSLPFFERAYPEYVARNAVRYVRWVVVHPAYQSTGEAASLAVRVFAALREQDVLMVFDTPSVTQATDEGGFAAVVQALANSVGIDNEVRLLDTQRYFALEMRAADASVAAPTTDEPSAADEQQPAR